MVNKVNWSEEVWDIMSLGSFDSDIINPNMAITGLESLNPNHTILTLLTKGIMDHRTESLINANEEDLEHISSYFFTWKLQLTRLCWLVQGTEKHMVSAVKIQMFISIATNTQQA